MAQKVNAMATNIICQDMATTVNITKKIEHKAHPKHSYLVSIIISI